MNDVFFDSIIVLLFYFNCYVDLVERLFNKIAFRNVVN